MGLSKKSAALGSAGLAALYLATTSREWINVFLAEYMNGGKKRFKVPAAVKVVL